MYPMKEPKLIIPFSKYHGLGNHFIIVDNREGRFDFTERDLVKAMCDVRTGIGADCLLEVRDCENRAHKNCAFQIASYQCDGTVDMFCGNGSRCVVKYACHRGIVQTDQKFTFCGFDDEHSGLYDVKAELIHVGMRDVTDIKRYDDNNYFLFTGSPIHVVYVDDVYRIDVQTLGDQIRFNKQLYPEGVHVMFVELDKISCEIKMRSYELGLNSETWACGTGAVGAALVAKFRQNEFKDQNTFVLDVNVRLGMLQIKATQVALTQYTDMYLIGPASHVFDGAYFVKS